MRGVLTKPQTLCMQPKECGGRGTVCLFHCATIQGFYICQTTLTTPGAVCFYLPLSGPQSCISGERERLAKQGVTGKKGLKAREFLGSKKQQGNRRGRSYTMSREKGRSVQKEQSKKTTSTYFLSVPAFFQGFNSKVSSESDAVRSPTSPLDKVFFSKGNSNLGSPRKITNIGGRSKHWGSIRVGLGLLDSIDDSSIPCGEELGKSGNRSIVFGSQMRLNVSTLKSIQVGQKDDDPVGAFPKSLPHEYGIFSKPYAGSLKPHSVCSNITIEWKGAKLGHEEFGLLRSCSVDTSRLSLLHNKSIDNNHNSISEVLQSESNNSVLAKGDTNFDKIVGSLPISVDSACEILRSLSVSEIEQSEDYTCIISHGPNTRMTHIFGDCILETHTIESPTIKNSLRKVEEGSSWLSKSYDDLLSSPSDDDLSFCFSCKKKLEGQKDIYMHSGNKAFCSCECYDKETSTEEEMEKPRDSSVEEMFLEEMALASA